MHRSVVVVTPYRIQHGNSNSHRNFGVPPEAKPPIALSRARELSSLSSSRLKCAPYSIKNENALPFLVMGFCARLIVEKCRHENRIRTATRIKGVFPLSAPAERNAFGRGDFRKCRRYKLHPCVHTRAHIPRTEKYLLARFRHFEIILDEWDQRAR